MHASALFVLSWDILGNKLRQYKVSYFKNEFCYKKQVKAITNKVHIGFHMNFINKEFNFRVNTFLMILVLLLGKTFYELKTHESTFAKWQNYLMKTLNKTFNPGLN